MKNVNPIVNINNKTEHYTEFRDIHILGAFQCSDKSSVYIKTGEMSGICVDQGNGAVRVGDTCGFSETFKVIPATTKIDITF